MKASKIKIQISELTKLKLNDKEISNILGVSKRWIRECRRKLKIKTSFKRGRPKKDFKELKKIICSLINKENAQYPLSDYLIRDILNKQNIKCSQSKIFRMRYLMKIPPSRGITKIDLNRKLLYFTQGRYVWKENGNHTKRRNK